MNYSTKSNDSMFVFENVRYKNILEIDNMVVKGQRITCIEGQSGSGKTTILRLLNKMISPDSGDIYYRGGLLSDIDSVSLRRKVVMLSQEPAVFAGSVKDNLTIGLDFSDKPSAGDDELRDIMEMINLRKLLDENAEKLSGGEKQRLALGRVILMDPDVFLLDEPSSSLDENTETLIIQALSDYTRQKGKSLVMVTHSKRTARNFADEIIQVDEGKIIDAEVIQR